MADIKTRDVTRGTIKTLDRAASSMHHLKEETIRSKAAEAGYRYDNESAGSYAQTEIEHLAGDGTAYAARAGVDMILRSRDKAAYGVDPMLDANDTSIQSRFYLSSVADPAAEYGDQISRPFREQGIKTILDRKNKAKLADKEILTNAEEDRLADRIRGAAVSGRGSTVIRAERAREKNDAVGYRSGRIVRSRRKYSYRDDLVQRRRRELAIKRIREKNAAGGLIKRVSASGSGQSAGKVADRVRRLLRDVAGSAKSAVTALTAGGSAAILIVVILIICGGLFAMLGDEDGNDFAFDFYGIGYGDTAIVKVAQAELGNVGGDKFWKWYGFKSHVHWCACFVSWCGNECGYIKEGIIPKFAVVGDGARWFKSKNQWASRGYEPKGGDIIFFDFERDGLLDHVGIVESCDGKTVTTIEGNSGNACRRQTYKVGSKQIAGYGVPMYGMLIDPGDFTGMQANMVAWAKKIAADNSYTYKNWTPGNVNTHKCPVCHPGSGKGWNCIGFAFAVWHHGGGLKSRCNCGVIDNATWERLLNAGSDAKAARIAANRIGVPVIVIRNNGNVVPQSKIRAGDICGCFSGSHYYHTTFSIGNGEIVHCTSAGNAADEITKRKAIPCKVVIRYAGMK